MSHSRIKELEKIIKKHKALYYQGRPQIEDHEYDQLEEELKNLDEFNPVLRLIGTKYIGTNKVKHSKKMLSLAKTYDLDELKKWIAEEDIITMHKIDGVSCSLIYEEGVLKTAKTRGDGSEGEDITEKALWITLIPSTINSNEKLEVRGEIYCTEENFFYLSEEMNELGLDSPTSQRNIVAGLISRKENIELSRYLSFKAFDLLCESDNFKYELEKVNELEKLGFSLPKTEYFKNGAKIESEINETVEFMSNGDYQIDGLVLLYNSLKLQKSLGETAHHPRYKMAFKFSGESKETEIKRIDWSVSRNGFLTPVALIDSIELSGAMISRVTLHNYGMVKKYNLKKGDKIEIIRSGEVIPKFLKVIRASSNDFIIPERCNSCDSKLEIEEIRLICKNKKCPGKTKESILNYIKKIGIDDISSKRLDELINSGLIKEIPDIYRVKKEDLLKINKVKDKLADKLIKSIKKSKEIDLITFLSSLGLTGGAYNKCEKVVTAGYDTIDKIKNLSLEQLTKIDSFAEKSAHDLIKSLKEKDDIINDLISLGMKIETKSEKQKTLTGKKLCITGTLSEKRSVIESLIRDNGGQVTSSITKKTDFLICNDKKSTSSKLIKAKELKISIISEEEFKSILENKL